jgi:competence protein ComEC
MKVLLSCLYDYPFLFVFFSLLSFSFYKEHSCFYILFALLAIFSIFRFRVFILSVVFVFAAYLSSIAIYQNKSIDSSNTVKGAVYDVRGSKRGVAIYVHHNSTKICLFASKMYNNIYPGDTIIFKSHLKSVNTLNPSSFKRYLYMNNINYLGYAYNISKIKHSSIWGHVMRIRKTLEDEFYYFLKPKELYFLQNAIFGDSFNKNSIKQIFIDTQTAHILSVSGMHMSFVFGIFYLLFYNLFALIPSIYKRFDLKFAASLISFVPVFLYFNISGMHLPAIRSFAMIMVFIIAMINGYERNAYNLLLFVASIFIILFGYRIVFSASFVLSFFMSFAAIYTYSFVLSIGLRRLTSYALFSFMMCIFSMPLTAFYFHKISYTAFLSNLIIVPYFGAVIMPLSFLSILAYLSHIFYIKLTVFAALSILSAYFFNILEFLSSFKPISIELSYGWVIASYLVVFLILYAVQRKISTLSR